ncbi:uncharacterized protein fam169ab isoform X2 [Salminus brasiliensis]|uniref:uncharacterized protein fam169ab isoform X2 n=1 Tax=Salminus brasiliensis TaxID=930266 RepID=UPI003B83843C
MEFPVDVLGSVSHEELERSAHSYMSDLLYSDPDHGQYFTLTTGRKVRISLSNVGFVPLYGANLKHKVLALFTPEDQFTAVALLLDDQWYAVDAILRTANPSREGLLKVRSVGERIVLYVLNRIVYRTTEMSAGEVPFLCHGESDYAKILWKNGEAVGFYSVKPKGSVCSNFVSQCYLLPVMDSIFVRRGHRGKGHGLQMLEDFVDSFKDDELGMKFPLSPAMSKVCRHYLNRYPADVDLLWEVEGVGGPYQRTRVASKLDAHTLKGGLLSRGKDDSANGQASQDKVTMNEETSLDITEEILVVNKRLKAAEEMDNPPISTRTRSSEHKRKKRMREEKEESEAQGQPEKISRLEEPEPVLEPATVTLEVEGEKGGEETEELEAAADGVGEEAVATEAPAGDLEPEEQAVEVNGELAEEQEEEELNKEAEADLAEEEAQGSKETDPVLQNGTADEEEMDVEESVEEQDAVDTADTPEEAPAEEPREVGGEEPEEELAPVAEEHQEDVVSPAAEEGFDEDSMEQEAPPATEEELKEDSISVVEEKEPVEERKEVASAPGTENEHKVTPEAEESLDVAPEAEEVASVEETATETAIPPAEESLEEVAEAPSEGQPVQEEAMEAEESPVEQEGMTEAAEELSKEEERQPVAETGKQVGDVAAMGEDECRGEGDEKTSDESPDPDVRVLRGGRSKAVPPTPKRSSKRLSRKEQREVLVEDEEQQEEESATGEEEKEAPEEEMVTTEEEKPTSTSLLNP